jgi:hypothetical protein
LSGELSRLVHGSQRFILAAARVAQFREQLLSDIVVVNGWHSDS